MVRMGLTDNPLFPPHSKLNVLLALLFTHNKQIPKTQILSFQEEGEGNITYIFRVLILSIKH